MIKTWRSSSFLAGTALLGAIALSGTTVLAGTVSVPMTADVISSISETKTQDLEFGNTDLIPGGDEVTINAADTGNPGSSGNSTPTISSLNGSGVDTAGFTEGNITVTSSLGTDFDITITYPADGAASLSDGSTTVPINNVEVNSGDGAGGVIAHVGGTPTIIYIGGTAVFPAAATASSAADADDYTGSMDIILDYN